MSHSKHVTSFMGHHTCCSPKYFIIFRNVLLNLKKSWIISCKRKNTCPIFNACQAKHKIPFIFRIEICYCHSNEAKGIRFEFFLQFHQNLFCIVLRLFCIFVDSSIYSIQYIGLFHYLDFQRIKKAFTEISQFYYELLIDLLLQRLYIDNISFIIHNIMKLTFVSIKCLSLLFMVPQPISFLRFFNWVEERNNLLKRLSDPIWTSRQTSNCYFSGCFIRHFEQVLHIVNNL